MKINGWMTNTNLDEVNLTQQILKSHDAINIKVDEQGQDGPEYTWDQFCDSDNDLINIVSVMLFYADRSEQQIAAIKEKLAALLVEYPAR
jgi:hypothetical protein